MKFDVIVGNPPYQRSTSKAYKLWIDFLKKANDLTKDNSYIAFITPSLLWTGRTKNMFSLRDLFVPYVDYINFNANKYFNVSEKICWYIINKKLKNDDIIIKNSDNESLIPRINNTICIDNRSKTIYSIIDKIESCENKLKFISDYETSDGAATPKFLLDKNIIKKNKDNIYNIEFIHSGAQKYWTNSNHKFGGKLKVFINWSSSYHNMFYGYGVVGKQVVGIPVKDEYEANNVIDILTKKIFIFYIKNEKNGGFNTGIYKLPKIDFSRSWTDKELYKHFNLTQEEIDYIEASV